MKLHSGCPRVVHNECGMIDLKFVYCQEVDTLNVEYDANCNMNSTVLDCLEIFVKFHFCTIKRYNNFH